MAANQERAERLRLLKSETPGVKWRQLAEFVGVVERSVYDWLKSGAMEFDNAVRAAEFFTAHGRPTDARWLYFGADAASPDLMTALRDEDPKTTSERLDRIEAMLAELLERVAARPAADKGAKPKAGGVATPAPRQGRGGRKRTA